MEELNVTPSGILMHRDFITAEHEAKLIHIFRHELTWPERTGRASLHYGYHFSYKTFGIDHETPYVPFPSWLTPLLPLEDRAPDQVCLQYYPPGAGIPPHVDTHSAFSKLYALSLGSPVMMQFRHDGATGEKVEVDLPPRGMMRMRGNARLHWTHAIKSRKTDKLEDGTVRLRGERWSITYRWALEGGICECGNERLCDTAMGRKGIEREYRWKLEGKGDAEEKSTGEAETSTGEGTPAQPNGDTSG